MPSRKCAFCGTLAHMTEIAGPHQVAANAYAQVWTAAFKCANCLGINTAVYTGARTGPSWSDTFHGQNDQLSWYPQQLVRRAYNYVPDEIAAAAGEAHAVRSVGAISSSIMVGRAVVEATAKDKGITSGRLVQKIDALAEAGHIREATRDAAHEIRHAGNDMAHGDFGQTPTGEDADDLLVLMDEVLEEVYEGPGRVARLKQARTEASSLETAT
jgi:hypothetical protein